SSRTNVRDLYYIRTKFKLERPLTMKLFEVTGIKNFYLKFKKLRFLKMNKLLIIFIILLSFVNCLKEYPELDGCEGLAKVYLFGDTLFGSDGNKPNIQNNETTKDTILLYCLRAYQLRKSDPPDFYENPKPR
ncbi:MAG: hypothetical protein KDK36_20890, partial [Leptospiraceae bacterium]|nr:hypothetical protein [Leptospiraceae bacterium]